MARFEVAALLEASDRASEAGVSWQRALEQASGNPRAAAGDTEKALGVNDRVAAEAPDPALRPTSGDQIRELRPVASG